MLDYYRCTGYYVVHTILIVDTRWYRNFFWWLINHIRIIIFRKKKFNRWFFFPEFVRLLPIHITLTRICILAYFWDKIQGSRLLLSSQTLSRITSLLFRQTLRISSLILRQTWFTEDCIFFQWDNLYWGLRHYWVKLALPRIVKLTYI